MKFRRLFVFASVGAICVASLAACSTFDYAATKPVDQVDLRALKLQAGDKVKITVFGEDKLSGDYEIDPTGSVSLPLAGTVQAAGLTKPELERALMARFSKGNYIKDPMVTVEIAAYRPFYVLGEVERPGEYAFRSGLNVMSAIAIAGGSTYRATRSRIEIQRAGEIAFTEYPLSPDVFVYPGDLVRVPERYF